MRFQPHPPVRTVAVITTQQCGVARCEIHVLLSCLVAEGYTSCRAGGREIRRLENASTAPVYSAFAEATTGAAAARSLGLADYLQQRFGDAVCVHLAARVASNALDQWLALRLQLASAAVVGVLAFLAVASQACAAPGEICWPAGAPPAVSSRAVSAAMRGHVCTWIPLISTCSVASLRRMQCLLPGACANCLLPRASPTSDACRAAWKQVADAADRIKPGIRAADGVAAE